MGRPIRQGLSAGDFPKHPQSILPCRKDKQHSGSETRSEQLFQHGWNHEIRPRVAIRVKSDRETDQPPRVSVRFFAGFGHKQNRVLIRRGGSADLVAPQQ